MGQADRENRNMQPWEDTPQTNDRTQGRRINIDTDETERQTPGVIRITHRCGGH